MSSAQENSNNFSTSVVQKSDHRSSLGYGSGHAHSSKGKYYFYFAGVKAYTDDESFIQKYGRYQDTIEDYVQKNWYAIADRSIQFGYDLAAAGYDTQRILDVIYNFVKGIPYSEDFEHALKKIGEKYAESRNKKFTVTNFYQ